MGDSSFFSFHGTHKNNRKTEAIKNGWGGTNENENKIRNGSLKIPNEKAIHDENQNKSLYRPTPLNTKDCHEEQLIKKPKDYK